MKKFLKRYWLIIISIIYLIWPIDFISDVFGPMGLMDDAALVLAALVREVVYHLENKKTPD